jgi:hypothetical protein
MKRGFFLGVYGVSMLAASLVIAAAPASALGAKRMVLAEDFSNAG